MNKIQRDKTANELLDRYFANIERTDSISKLGLRHDLLTTEEIVTLDKLDEEFTLLSIECETFLADLHCRRRPIKFLKRYLFKNR